MILFSVYQVPGTISSTLLLKQLGDFYRVEIGSKIYSPPLTEKKKFCRERSGFCTSKRTCSTLESMCFEEKEKVSHEAWFLPSPQPQVQNFKAAG